MSHAWVNIYRYGLKINYKPPARFETCIIYSWETTFLWHSSYWLGYEGQPAEDISI